LGTDQHIDTAAIDEAVQPQKAPKRATDFAQYARTRVGNGSELLPGVDKRSIWVRRAKELIAEHLGDLGGEANTSAAERSLVRRIAILTTELERLEVKFAEAEAKDEAVSNSNLDLYVRSVGGLRRLLESIGLQRRAKDITNPPPSAEEYFAFKQRQKEQANGAPKPDEVCP
jgi:hypothetical protein